MNLIGAKSPDIDNWDADDDLNKTTTSISSPRSGRRSRSPPDSRRTKRDWSKSPEYRRRRSYERGVLDKKLLKTREYESSRRSPKRYPPVDTTSAPRTPSPENVLSPAATRRPRTPESRSSDDFNKHKYAKSVQSPQSVPEEKDSVNISTALSSLVPTEEEVMSQGEIIRVYCPIFEAKTKILYFFSFSGEAFEPILSDDEIGDDAGDQYEMEYEDADLSAIFTALKHFNPFTEDLKHFTSLDDQMSANARELIELATKCLHRSKLKENTSIERTFIESQSNELRENWVQAAEQLIQIINLIYNLAGATQAKSQQALNSLILLNRQQLVDWMRIGLNFDCANSQQQPGYKIRHIKCGIRLIELLAVDEMFIESLIFKEKFNVFEYLYRLYAQKFMALSIKLMVCRAIYACLDTKIGIEFFTRLEENEDIKPYSAENGYQKLVKLIQENPLTRIKFALKSILKKVNLFESLQVVRDILKRHFISDKIKMETTMALIDVDDQISNERLLNNCLKQIWSAITWDVQSYSQPKRFLPISTKFEKVIDLNANKSTVNSFLRYFRINGLLESLLVIVSNSNSNNIISEQVFDQTLLLLESLCRIEHGLNYLCEKSEVTNALVKSLLQAPLEVHANQLDDVEMIENDPMAVAPLDDYVEIDEESRRYRLAMEIAYKVTICRASIKFYVFGKNLKKNIFLSDKS